MPPSAEIVSTSDDEKLKIQEVKLLSLKIQVFSS